MRRVLPALLPVLALLACAASASADSFSAPAATSYGATMAISYSLSEAPQNNIRFEFTYTGGQMQYVGHTWTVLLTGVSISKSFTMSTTDPAADTGNVASVTPSHVGDGTGLPEGTYSVVLKYTPSMFGGPVTTAATTGVVVDRTTQAPTLSSPAAAATVGESIAVQFNLPEAAASGSVQVLFVGAATSAITLKDAYTGPGSHSLLLDKSALTMSSAVQSVIGATSITDGTYDVVLAYQDVLGNPAATATSAGVVADTVTQPPTLLSPQSASAHENTIPVSYVLPEAASPGGVTLTISRPGTSRVLTLAGTGAGTHSATIDLSDLDASPGVTARLVGANTVPAGTYTVALSYTDAAINPVQIASATDVVFTTASAPPPPTTTTDTTPGTTPASTDPATGGDVPATPVATTPAPATTLSPKRLAARYSRVRTRPGTWRLRATFPPQAGARSYTLRVKKGARTLRGTCRIAGSGARRRVVCTATVRSAGRWSLRLAAAGADGVALAESAKTLRVR